MELTPTEDVVFFPAMLTLEKGEDRRIRVGLGATATFGDTEKTFRIFVEELPPPGTPGTPGVVRVLTKMGIPIFLAPSRTVMQPALRDLGLRDGRFVFTVANEGTVHFIPAPIRVRGLAEDGTAVFERQTDGWYVLAGRPRLYELELPQPACAQIRTLAVEVQVFERTLRDQLPTPAGACGR
jgi:fimbrial chaperone protein